MSIFLTVKGDAWFIGTIWRLKVMWVKVSICLVHGGHSVSDDDDDVDDD